MFTISQLFTAQTQAQYRAAIVAALVGLGIPANSWQSGGVFSTIVTIISALLAALNVVMVTLLQGFFLPTATGANLQVLAQLVYGIDPTVFLASNASGFVTLTNTGGGVYPVAIGAMIVSSPVNGLQYLNTTAFTIPPKVGAVNGTITVPVQSRIAGSAGNALPNTVTNLVTPFVGVSVNNSAAIVGRDAMSDGALRTLCLQALAARSVFGPRDAYAYAVTTALNISTQAPVNINRVTVSASSHTGIVNIYVAGPAGTTDPNDVTGAQINVDLIARPDAVTANVIAATPIAYTRTITVYVAQSNGTTTTQISTTAQTAIVSFMQNYPIGGKSDDSGLTYWLFANGLVGAIGAALSAIGVTLITVTGATDLALTPDEVATDSVVLAGVQVI